MDGLGGFLVGFIVATIITPLTIAWNMAASGRIIIKPIKDEHKNEFYIMLIFTQTKNIKWKMIFYIIMRRTNI